MMTNFGFGPLAEIGGINLYATQFDLTGFVKLTKEKKKHLD